MRMCASVPSVTADPGRRARFRGRPTFSGRGVAEIGGRKYKIAAADFMGFVAGSKPHAMRNPFKPDLVYLVGGNRWPMDVCDYPRIGKRRYRMNGDNAYLDLAALTPVKRNLK